MPRRYAAIVCAITTIVLLLLIVPVVEAQEISSLDGYGLEWLLIWLLPFGVTLAGISFRGARAADHAALALPVALVLALMGYSICGYAFQYGGYGLVTEASPMSHMLAEWSPLDPIWGPGWGLLGLRGFLFDIASADPAQAGVFLSELALVTTAVVIPLLALWGRMRGGMLLFMGLFVASIGYPITANWIRGGGWLMHLDITLNLGRGFVDEGLCTVFLSGGYGALAGLLALRHNKTTDESKGPARLPAAHLPMLVLIGGLVALLGWLATLERWTPGGGQSSWLVGTKALWALAGSTIGTLVYGWLIKGEADSGLTGRGILASVVVISAGITTFSVWQVLFLGVIVGFLLAPTMWLIEKLFDVTDESSLVANHLLAAYTGLLGVALVSDHWIRQLGAQALGLVGLEVLNLVLPWLVLRLATSLVNAPQKIWRKGAAGASGLEQNRRGNLGSKIGQVCSKSGRALWRLIKKSIHRVVQTPEEPESNEDATKR